MSRSSAREVVISRAARDASSPGGVIAYWHVDDVAAILERLTPMGVKEYQPLTLRGDAGGQSRRQ
jgi:hypothetical protein